MERQKLGFRITHKEIRMTPPQEIRVEPDEHEILKIIGYGLHRDALYDFLRNGEGFFKKSGISEGSAIEKFNETLAALGRKGLVHTERQTGNLNLTEFGKKVKHLI